MQAQIDAFKAVVARHDWAYDRSDDHGVWARGHDSWAHIQNMRKAAQAEGGEIAAQIEAIYADAYARFGV